MDSNLDDDVKQFLEEMDELVLIGQLVMEYQRSGNAEGGKACCY